MKYETKPTLPVFFMHRRFLYASLIVYGIFLLSAPCHAAADANHLYEKKRQLAQSFVAKLKGKLSSAVSHVPDDAAAPGDGADISQIAAGTEMQFRPISEKVKLDYDIYAIKGDDTFYLSLVDLLAALDFPIKMDEKAQTARGWFMREDWLFDLDVKGRRLTARGQDKALDDSDYQIVDGEVFISGDILSSVLGMTFTYDVSQQYVQIKSEYPLPVVSRIKRRKLMEQREKTGPDVAAKLPYKTYEASMFDLSTADMSMRSNYRRDGESGKTDLLNRLDTRLAGEVLRHDAYALVSVDDRDRLNSIVARMSKTSKDADLLGFMKARAYMMGDIDPATIPLTGDTGQELGFRVSNNPLSGTSYQNTRITGYALPGWDVELYRGAALIDSLTVDDTGRYEFTDVQLFSGENDFEILFYGSQGEIRRERLSLPLDQGILSSQGNTYDLSVSLQDTRTYTRVKSEDVDRNNPHLAGQYNFFVGDALAYAGFRAWGEEDESKIYLASGITSIVQGTIVDMNLAADEDGEAAARLGLRRKVAGWQTAAGVETRTDHFAPGDADLTTTLHLNAVARRNFTPPIGTSANIAISGDYREFSDGSVQKNAALSTGHSFGRISLSGTTRYTESDPVSGDKMQRIISDTSARARITSQLSARAGVTHLTKPESRLDRYFASANYRASKNLNFDAEIERRLEPSLTEGELKANYIHERFRFSPFLRLNSDNDLAAGLNISTSLIDTPYDTTPFLTSDRVSTQGMVSAHVYLDANGNAVFDDGDQPLPDVIVESVNSRRREKTGESGYALLTRLPVTIVTDIRVDKVSLPDPFMVPVNRGNSVLPRAGKIFEMEFPVQFSGEIDGTIYTAGSDGASHLAKYAYAVLLPLDPAQEPVGAKSAQDGFFVISDIPPGQYYLTVSAADAKSMDAARPRPQLVTITHQGETLYGQDIAMTGGLSDVTFDIIPRADMPDYTGAAGAAFIRIPGADRPGVLNLIHRLRMRDIVSHVTAGLTPVETKDAEGKMIRRYMVPGGALEDAWDRCTLLSARNLPCAVDLVPALPPPPVAAIPAIDTDPSAAGTGTQTDTPSAAGLTLSPPDGYPGERMQTAASATGPVPKHLQPQSVYQTR